MVYFVKITSVHMHVSASNEQNKQARQSTLASYAFSAVKGRGLRSYGLYSCESRPQLLVHQTPFTRQYSGHACHENFGPGGPKLAAKIGLPLPKMVCMCVLRS